MTSERGLKLALSAAAAAAACAFALALVFPRLRGTPPRLTPSVAFASPGLDASALRGRPWVADFVFTSCGGPCPLLSANMARLQRRLPAEVRLVSFTVDPETDTAEVLASYAARFGAVPGRWLFVRLEPGPLYQLLNAGFRLPVYIDPGAAPANRSMHTTKFVLVDAEGVVRGYYDGLSEAGLGALERDAARLLKERPNV